VVLIGGLATLIGLSRAGSTLFWRVGQSQLDSAELDYGRLLACTGLLALSPLLAGLAAPLLDYAQATVSQLHDLSLYHQAVLGGGAR
jgi:multicomponent K+:H+ antiporter subunit D